MTQWNPDCQGPCDCPGEEVIDLQAERCYCHSLEVPHVHTLGDHQKVPSPMKVLSTTNSPGGESWACDNHKLVQHRDRKPKWCNSCGRNANGQVIGGPRAFGRRVAG